MGQGIFLFWRDELPKGCIEDCVKLHGVPQACCVTQPLPQRAGNAGIGNSPFFPSDLRMGTDHLLLP